jgi:hypothetical protein
MMSTAGHLHRAADSGVACSSQQLDLQLRPQVVVSLKVHQETGDAQVPSDQLRDDAGAIR